ncbi:type IV pilin N-terminal domain-containing protein [Methanosarcina sp. Mfa9]|uniref:type IV pilin N-terminal domain-containing protein n=1 Tax=Methanosarcina sp. Mfa9 TaxID=3439063 RepID=UPI003F834623
MIKRGILLPDLKKIIRNRSAVSEVMGEVLLTTIAVLLVSFIAIFISTYDGATDIPHTQVKEWMDADADKIYLEHSGGEFLETDALEIAASINGERYVYNSSEIYTNLGNKSSWQLGDIIEIDTDSAWERGITNEDEVKVFLIDKTSRQVIQFLTLSLGETSSDWVTPQGAVTDTSVNGSATPFDVFETGDMYHTNYCPPNPEDSNIYEEFNFGVHPSLWGIGPGGNVTNVNLTIVYRVNDHSCRDLKLQIWDQDPSREWHEESLPEHNSFTSESKDLSAYINCTEDVANFKVRLLATANTGDNEKSLNVDYIAIYVS